MLAFLPSFSLSVFSSKAESLYSLCSMLGMPLAPLCHEEEGHPPAAAQWFTFTPHGLTKVRGAKHTGEARRDNGGIFSGLVYSKRQEPAKRSLLYPSHIPTQWVYKVSMLPHVPYSFVARICALREVVGEHLDPTSQQLHQAMCVEALNFWTSSYPPWLVSLSWCPWQAKTHILEHSTFPFASLGCSSRFAANWAVWGGGSQLPYTSNREEKNLNSHLLLATLAISAPSLEEDALCQMEGMPP